jgi:catechol 2,3-dioxygenase-like lactoylglutathione lyase family enzyme
VNHGLSIGLAAGLLWASAGLAQPSVPPLTDDIRPIRTSGVSLNVSDLERSKAFYTEVLGMKVGARVPAQGKAVEYLLGMTGDIRADTLVVLRQGEVKPGATGFGRIVLVVPNGRKMAERVAAAGYPVPQIRDGTNIVSDPDGYRIELYQRPAAAAR